MVNIAEEKSLPPLRKINRVHDRTSVRESALYQSLEVEKFRGKKLNESADITVADLHTIKIVTTFGFA